MVIGVSYKVKCFVIFNSVETVFFSNIKSLTFRIWILK